MAFMWIVLLAIMVLNDNFLEARARDKSGGIHLRINFVKHSRVGESEQQKEYTLLDNVRFEMQVEEQRNGVWVPFGADDVQLEFVRVDPLVTKTLENNNGTLSTVFQVPDLMGVYKFRVDYRRPGYDHLYHVEMVSVRPLKHNQHERFLSVAYPYYVSAFSMMLGVYLFSFVFLYYKENDES